MDLKNHLPRVLKPLGHRFANDYLDYLRRETNFASWTAKAKVLECDESEWANLYNLLWATNDQQLVSNAKMKRKWQDSVDAYSIPIITRESSGEVRRSSESERFEILVEAGVAGQLANQLAHFDAVTFLRKSRFQAGNVRENTLAKLRTVASQCATVAEKIANAGNVQPSPRWGKNVRMNREMFDEFRKNENGDSAFDARYLA